MLKTFLLAALQYASISVAVLYFYQGLINFLVLKSSSFSRKDIYYHIGLCVSSAFYSLIFFIQFLSSSTNLNLHLMHFVWMCGSLSNYFYIVSIKSYLKDSSRGLNFIKTLPLVSVAGAAFAYLSWILFDHPLFVDESQPLLTNVKNIYLLRVGGFNAHDYVKFLSIVVIIPTVYSAVYFLKNIYKHFRGQHKLLTFGIALDVFAILNDISVSLFDFEYVIPIIFIANLFEIMRITYDNQLQMGKQLQVVTQNYIQTSKLSEAGTYYAYLAHEIMNPLSTAMVYFNKLTKGHIQPSEASEKYVSAIQRQHSKIERLARNVKKYTRASLDGELKPERLQPLVEDALETISIRAYDKGVDVKYNPTHTDITINCLSDQITQVITNMINNAIDAVAGLEERWVHIDHILSPEGLALITIKDSGNGIPADVRDKIFEHRFTTKKESGVGLGLSICHTIINNHGGRILLNHTGQNTEFQIELPMQK